MLPPPPYDQKVTLTIQQTTTGLPGYVTTYGDNGKMYAYLYSGGNRSRGNVEFQHGKGAVIVNIMLIDSPNFVMERIDIADDLPGDRSQFVPPPQVEPNGVTAHIHDRNTYPVQAYYAVGVVDKTDPAHPVKINCDPGIVNN
jgi:hypothetical protein